ncbi:50S ribosomal protein L20 [Striga asiatica]|uniref:50S ribosomal protein L20 n=1 Tax=Striga asiatica TaxID=4170 RepID=A0A5A7Q307_STRAF|nr:50S ribosomal protein L20 [Striga asiatica]
MEPKNPAPASSEEIVRTGPKLSFMAASERRTMKKKSTKYLIRSPMNSVDDQGQHLGRDGISDSVATEIKGAAKVKIRFPLSNFTSSYSLDNNGRSRTDVVIGKEAMDVCMHDRTSFAAIIEMEDELAQYRKSSDAPQLEEFIPKKKNL